MDKNIVKQNNLNAFFNKKTVVSFFLSILVVFIHIHSFDGYEYTGALGSFLQFLGLYLTAGMTSVAIRLFFVISGVLFYRNYSYEKTLSKYKTRFKSLVIPYLFWCTFYTVVCIGLYYTPVNNFAQIGDPFSVKNVLLGIGINYYYKSFWFILNLIVFTLLCPVIYTLIKNKYIGAIAIAAVIVLYAFNIRIPETAIINGVEYSIFWKADSIIFYLIGAYIGKHHFELFARKKSKATAILGLVGFIICSVYITFNHELGAFFSNDTVKLFGLMLFCASTWIMFDLFSFDKKPKEFCEYSFMMFALNYYLGVYISKIMFLVLPKHQIFCLVNLCITLVFEFGFILLTSYLLKKHLPKFYNLITGGR